MQEGGLDAVQEGGLVGAAEHECQCACCGADDTAGHGGVDEGTRGIVEDRSRDLAGGGRINGRVIDEKAVYSGLRAGKGRGEDGGEDGLDMCWGGEGEVDGCL